ncbi:hypothetical protein EZV62_023799 [Acer yangbiense]|uniref:CCHC-type domain-containing protein n=1 Tax=Acer yangbiense TaxID=1000413 RepID=A0A5C7H3J1_9ROSI|nr:hypothetical protein EZV62_023799 [Acer yangbiense]
MNLPCAACCTLVLRETYLKLILFLLEVEHMVHAEWDDALIGYYELQYSPISCGDSNVWNAPLERSPDAFTGGTEKRWYKENGGGPWSFDKALLVLEEPVGKGDIQGMSFNKTAFWIQIHNVPLICMIAEIWRFLGEMVGKVKEVDTGKSGDCVGKFIRVRVVVQVDKPLHRILRVDVMGDETESVMLLIYKRLPEHCYRCGHLGHAVRDCLEKKIGNGLEDFDQLFGPWLKAESPIKSGRFCQQWEGNRYEENNNMLGILGGVPSLNPGSFLTKIGNGFAAAGDMQGLLCQNERTRKIVEKDINVSHARRNLHATLVEEERELYVPLKVTESQSVPKEVREEINVHENGDVNGFSMVSTEIKVDRGLLVHTSLVEGEEATVKNQNDPKARKWKRWARDEARRDSVMDGGSKLGKREAGSKGLVSEKK